MATSTPCAAATAGGGVQVVVDTTVWLAYFTGAQTPEADHLDALLGRSPLVLGDLILAEVLHALPDELHRRQAEAALLKLWLVEMGGFEVARRSAVHYHTLKARGIAVRAAECLIATFCIQERFALLHASPAYEPFEKLGLTTVRV